MNSLTRYAAPSDLSMLRREMDRMFDAVLPARTDGRGTSSVWTPRTDLAETDEAFVLHLDVPGVAPDDVEITLEDDTLTVTGERSLGALEDSGRVHRVERRYGRFFRSFRFTTPVNPDRVEAVVEHGVLRIEVAKAEASKPRRIPVRQSALASGDSGPATSAEITVDTADPS